MTLLSPLSSLFSSVEILTDNGKIWYDARQVCLALNYQLGVALNFVDIPEKKAFTIFRDLDTWFFSSKGVYQLVFIIQRANLKPQKSSLFNYFVELGDKGYSLSSEVTQEQLLAALEEIQSFLIPPESTPEEEQPPESQPE
jgi:hypothetical protein